MLMKKLHPNQLENPFSQIVLNSDYQSSLPCQEQATNSLLFGLKVKKNPFHIFVSSQEPSTHIPMITKFIEDNVDENSSNKDLAYVHNFLIPEEPNLLILPPNTAEALSYSMQKFTNLLFSSIQERFYSGGFQNVLHKENLKKEEAIQLALDEFNKGYLRELRCFAQFEDSKILIRPYNLEEERFYTEEELNSLSLEDEHFYTDEEFNSLSLEEQEAINELTRKASLITNEISPKIQEIINAYFQSLDEHYKVLFDELFLMAYSKHLSKLSNELLSCESFKTFISDVNDYVFDNMSLLLPEESNRPPAIPEETVESLATKLMVNPILMYDEGEGNTVLYTTELEPSKFLGAITHSIVGNSVHSNHLDIHGGEILLSRGGYLVLNIEDFYNNPYLWEELKYILKNRKLDISRGASFHNSSLFMTNLLNPEPIPFDVKLILVGDYSMYDALASYDPDFKQIFKVHSYLQSSSKIDENSLSNYVGLVNSYVEEMDYPALEDGATRLLLQYCSRQSGSQKEISLIPSVYQDLLDEAEAWRNILGEQTLSEEVLKKSILERDNRNSYLSKMFRESIKDGLDNLTLSGKDVGEINALTVMSFQDAAVGAVAKLSASTHQLSTSDTKAIQSSDRNVKLTGKIHDKSIEILNGYLGENIYNGLPKALSTNLSFEQNYGGIEGDSATLATLFAVLSSKSGVPINQNFGITGSMSQKGVVQVIGGVSEKIEGFFYTYKELHPNGVEGEIPSVIIPKNNIQHLHLPQEIVDAIASDEFRIYPVETVDEVSLLLTGFEVNHLFDVIKNKLQEIKLSHSDSSSETVRAI